MTLAELGEFERAAAVQRDLLSGGAPGRPGAGRRRGSSATSRATSGVSRAAFPGPSRSGHEHVELEIRPRAAPGGAAWSQRWRWRRPSARRRRTRGPPLAVHQAVPDAATDTLTIDGEHFGPTPFVTLDLVPLDLRLVLDTRLMAAVPIDAMPPGRYLLTVSRGPAAADRATLEVSLGPVLDAPVSRPRGRAAGVAADARGRRPGGGRRRSHDHRRRGGPRMAVDRSRQLCRAHARAASAAPPHRRPHGDRRRAGP